MDIQKEINNTRGFINLELLAKQVVEGFISGMHKSPFHGFSAEFAEHKVYNSGESTKHIDWKLFAKTDKLYTKRYEEETNLRCHIIIDNSSSMHYPSIKEHYLGSLNKISFSVLATACLMNILKKQRDAIGLSIYSDQYDYYAPEKGSERHHQMLLSNLNDTLLTKSDSRNTETYLFLHQIAEKINRRSLIFLFTDMFQVSSNSETTATARTSRAGGANPRPGDQPSALQQPRPRTVEPLRFDGEVEPRAQRELDGHRTLAASHETARTGLRMGVRRPDVGAANRPGHACAVRHVTPELFGVPLHVAQHGCGQVQFRVALHRGAAESSAIPKQADGEVVDRGYLQPTLSHLPPHGQETSGLRRPPPKSARVCRGSTSRPAEEHPALGGARRTGWRFRRGFPPRG